MDHSDFQKKIILPADFKMPSSLVFQDLRAKTLTRTDLEADMEGVNSSMDTIRKTRGGSWPSELVSKDFDLLDLAWHEREFRDGDSFAYVVYNDKSDYIGCFYLYPMGMRTTLTQELLEYDLDASWWVTSDAYDQGYYEKLYAALREWLADLPFDKVYYSNKEIPQI